MKKSVAFPALADYFEMPKHVFPSAATASLALLITLALVQSEIVAANTLLACGAFAEAGGKRVNSVAVLRPGPPWHWAPLGDGIDGFCYVTTVFQGKPVVAGSFGRAGDTFANNIATWNGTHWSALGVDAESGTNGEVRALAVYNGRLVVGGYFTGAGNVTVANIALWDGDAWSALGSGVDNSTSNDETVLSLAVFNGKLVAGGKFRKAGDVSVNYIAAWDGVAWSPLGSGVGGQVSALIAYNGGLIAGGLFSLAGGVAVNGTAIWNDSVWAPVGLGPSPPKSYKNPMRWTRSFAIFKEKLVAATYR